ncbi:carbohydrate ABC transporter permease, partial [Streptomyces sp. NPDC052020]
MTPHTPTPAPAPTAPALPARRPRRIAPALTYLSLITASLVVLIPLVVVFLTSLKTSQEVTDGGALSLPGNWLNLDNYATAFTDGRMLSAFGNTAFILLFSITGTVLIGSMTA